MAAQPAGSSSTTRAVIFRVAQVLITFAALIAILFLTAGTYSWTSAYAYFAVCLLASASVAIIFLPHRMDVIAERSGTRKGAKGWDKVISLLQFIFGTLITLVVCGLDKRFYWSSAAHPSSWVQGIGLGAVAAGYALFVWAMASNQFFSTLVRIQSERGHRVVTAGPYRWVRHPGYLGMVAYTLFVPVLLGTWWGLIPAFVGVSLVVVRTALEDRTLQAELDGYKDFAAQVKWRLLPGIW